MLYRCGMPIPIPWAYVSKLCQLERREEMALEDSAQGLTGNRASETWCR